MHVQRHVPESPMIMYLSVTNTITSLSALLVYSRRACVAFADVEARSLRLLSSSSELSFLTQSMRLQKRNTKRYKRNQMWQHSGPLCDPHCSLERPRQPISWTKTGAAAKMATKRRRKTNGRKILGGKCILTRSQSLCLDDDGGGCYAKWAAAATHERVCALHFFAFTSIVWS